MAMILVGFVALLLLFRVAYSSEQGYIWIQQNLVFFLRFLLFDSVVLQWGVGIWGVGVWGVGVQAVIPFLL